MDFEYAERDIVKKVIRTEQKSRMSNTQKMLLALRSEPGRSREI